MHRGIVNKTRYGDLGKPMKQTSFTVKNLGEKHSRKAIHYSKAWVKNQIWKFEFRNSR